MGKYFVIIEKSAQKELQIHYRSGDKLSIKRIEQIILELTEHPETGIGNPEKLKFDLSGYWSRRINRKDRIVYRINNQTVIVNIISAKGHYEGK
jgi:toxin YoeB